MKFTLSWLKDHLDTDVRVEALADKLSSMGLEVESIDDPGKKLEPFTIAKVLEAKFGEPRKTALTWKPQNSIAVDDEQGERLLRLIETLEDHDDVQHVYANFEVSDALLAKMSA